MRFVFLALIGLFPLVPKLAYGGEICVVNSADDTYLFASEAHEGRRETAQLTPGQTLCVSGGESGVVSVYEHADALEGCSRLVSAGQTEALLRYVDFDRCFWSSNSG
ncbi:MAG: hypothetical protein GY945_16740 [Rhodobacteraceae bacterium]|nr:hypothetical protein [Paracoccaceae bacterium]